MPRLQQNIFFSFIGCILVSLSVLPIKNEAPKHPKVLLISFDGFRSDYCSKTATPHFDAFIKDGVKAEAMTPIFPSKTFPNHYSIATGLYANHHGIIGNTMYDPNRKEWYKISDRQAVQDGSWYGGEPIWNTAMKHGLQTGTVFWVGSEADIQGMYPNHWMTYDSHLGYHARVDSVVKWMTLPGDHAVDFATLYFENVDHAGHKFGPSSDSVVAAIQKADATMGYLVRQMKAHHLWESTDVIVVSDHGMTNLKKDKVIFLDSIINPNDLDYVVANPMTLIQPKPGKLNQVYDQLKAHENHYKVYLRSELPPRYHLSDNPRVSDIVLVCDLPYTLLTSGEDYSKFLEKLPAGNHGFDNREKDMQAFFAAHGPDFKSGYRAKAFPNVDVYPLMCHLLGIKAAPNDGDYKEVESMLISKD